MRTGKIIIIASNYYVIMEFNIVNYDTCDLSSTFLHDVKLGSERSEGSNHAVQSAP